MKVIGDGQIKVIAQADKCCQREHALTSWAKLQSLPDERKQKYHLHVLAIFPLLHRNPPTANTELWLLYIVQHFSPK